MCSLCALINTLKIKAELMKVASQKVHMQMSDVSRKILRDKHHKQRCLSTVFLTGFLSLSVVVLSK